ncbi:phage tail tip fiber protein [Pigmentiphaga daeguensis]|uniref:Phage tail protein n=1 Tax=Pigmentiphaga daeguensis TaxID=414049 RepID=A0ABN1BAQ8_9BURK
MPAAIPLIPVLLGPAGIAAIGAYTAAALSIGSALIVGAIQQNRAKKAARSAYEASLRDRTLVVRSPMATRSLVYGRTQVVNCPLVWANSRGSKKEYLDLVIALAGHEIDAIEQIRFDDEDIGALDAAGYVTGGKYFKTGIDRTTRIVPFTVTDVPEQVVTLPEVPADGTVWAGYPGGGGSEDGPESLRILSIEGKTVTVETSELWLGRQVQVSYNRPTADAIVRVVSRLGSPDQQAIPELVDVSDGKWTAEHRGRGVPYLWVQLRYDEDLFPSGIPNVAVVVRGKRCYDPRTGQYIFTRNPALHALDYLMDPLGFNSQLWEIDMATVIAAANVCDEQVAIEGGTQPRYQADGVLSTEADRLENLGMIMSAMAGMAVYSQGTWKLHPGAYRVPVIDLDEDALTDIEPLSVRARAERKDLFNAVKGAYIDPEKSWQATDFPMVTNAVYEAQDNGERITTELQLPMTTDVVMAQRLAKIELEDHRQAVLCAMPFNMRAYRLQPGDTFRLTIGRYGWDRKEFRVIDRTFSIEKGVRLTFKETSASIWDWNMGEATVLDPAPDTNLPDPFFVPEIGGLVLASGDETVLVQADGTAVPRLRVTWNPVTYAPLADGGRIQLQAFVQDLDDPVIDVTVDGSDTQAYLAPVRTGMPYRVRARGLMRIGVRGRWAYSDWHLVDGKRQPPPAITALATAPLTQGIALAWTFPSGLMDIGRTEIWYGPTSSRTDAIKLSDFAWPQASHRLMGLAFGVELFFWARLVDRSGNIGPWYPTGEGVRGVSQAEPTEILEGIAGKIGRTELGEEITKQIDDTRAIADQGTWDAAAARVAIEAEKVARIEGDRAIARQVFGVTAGSDDWNAGSRSVFAGARTVMTTIAEGDQAVAQLVQQVQAQVADQIAGVTRELSATANELGAVARDVGTLAVKVGNTTAAVEEVAQAQVDTDGKLAAMYAVKVGVTVDGRYYQAGIGVGVENTPDGMQTQVYALADRWALLNLTNGVVTTPFVVENGQTVIAQALIGDARITNGMIANAAITRAKIEDAAIDSAKIEDLAVTTAKIANLAVDEGKIKNLSVSTLKIQDRAVTIPVAYTSPSGTIASDPWLVIASATLNDVIGVSMWVDFDVTLLVRDTMWIEVWFNGTRVDFFTFNPIPWSDPESIPSDEQVTRLFSYKRILTSGSNSGYIEIKARTQDFYCNYKDLALLVLGCKK